MFLERFAFRMTALVSDPRAYWEDMATEPDQARQILIPHVLVFSALPAGATFVGSLLKMSHVFSFSGAIGIGASLLLSVFKYATTLVVWFGLSAIIDMLAHAFGAKRHAASARKLAFGTLFPTWIAGIFSIVPFGALAWLAKLAAFGYAAYLLYVGLPLLNGTPQRHAVKYAATVAVALAVVSVVFLWLLTRLHGCAAPQVLL